jgi:hypothetical protein
MPEAMMYYNKNLLKKQNWYNSAYVALERQIIEAGNFMKHKKSKL